jgi:hypothetical protein
MTTSDRSSNNLGVLRVAISDETTTAITGQELLYILESAPGSGVDRARDLLNLPSGEDSQAWLGAGLSSLYVRQLVNFTNDTVELVGAAALVGMVITSDSNWIELAFVSESVTDAALLVRFDDIALLFSPRLFGTFDVRAVSPELSDEALAKVVFGFLLDGPGVVFAHQVSKTSDSAVAIRLTTEGILEMSGGDGSDLLSGKVDGGRPYIEHYLTEVFAR